MSVPYDVSFSQKNTTSSFWGDNFEDKIPPNSAVVIDEIPKVVQQRDARVLAKDEEKIAGKNRSCSNLLSQLFFSGIDAFLSVCKSWKSLYVLPYKPESQSPSLLLPYNKLFNPICTEYRHIDFVVELQSISRILAAKEDWLLMCGPLQRDHLFFLNPFTKTQIAIPDFPSRCMPPMCFSSLPTSTDWQIVAGATNENGHSAMFIVKRGEESWNTFELTKKFDFLCCCAVMHKGSCYFLNSDAELLIYNPKTKIVRFHKASESISQGVCANRGVRANHVRVNRVRGNWFHVVQYLLETDNGKLMAVFRNFDGSWIRVCQWDNHKEEWQTVQSLGNRMLFVSRPWSSCRVASLTGTGNKIYFPAFLNDYCFFYSLSTQRYHTFASSSSYKNISGVRFSPFATWIKP